MLKRGISLFLALAMVFCIMPVETMAAEILTGDEVSSTEETTEPISTEETAEAEAIPSEQMSTDKFDSVNENKVSAVTQAESATSGAVLRNSTAGPLTYRVNEYDDTACSITDCDPSVSGSLEIPAEIDGYIVTEIANGAFSECKFLENVIIPEGVKLIGNDAFSGCSALKNMTIPKGVINIGDSVFSGCSSLESVIIPEGVRTIGNSIFKGCSSLKSINIPKGVNYIGNSAFEGCSSLESITIAEGITSIGNTAFSGCSALKSIVLPEGVAYIYPYAFYGCSSLNSVIMQKGVKIIGDHAFFECFALESITIPEGVTDIGDYAFSNCSALTSVTMTDGVTSIGKNSFSDCSLLKSVIIPKGITTIADATFSGCSSLESVDLPEGITDIGDKAFAGCPSLKSIIIPEGVASIGAYAFGSCSALKSVTLSKGITTIDYGAFYYCTSLESLVIPEGVISIGNQTFYNCTSLKDVVIPEGVTSIGNDAFYYCTSLENVIIPKGVTSIGNNAFYHCASLENITIPEEVTSIGYSSFAGCSSLESAVIPEGVISIGHNAFDGCTALKSVTIPQSVTDVGIDLFENCPLLISAGPIDDEVEYNVKLGWKEYIPEGAFQYSSSGLCSLENVTIPEGVKSIGEKAFYFCSSLKSVVIPEGFESVENLAFHGCNALKDVYYAGTKENREEIESKYTGYSELFAATWHYNSTGPADSSESQENLQLCYFSEWDAENQIAYFEDGQAIGLGAEVTEETDTSFLDSVEKMLNQYVLVETRPRDDGMIGPDILIRMELVEAGTGTVQEYTEDSLTVNDTVYPLALREEVPVVGADKGAEVLYGVQDEKIVIIIPLTTTTMCLEDWNSASRVLTVSNNLSKYTYKVSTLASEESLAFLNASRDSDKTYSIEFASDASNKIAYRIYRIYEEPEDPEYYDTPRYETTEEALLGEYAMDWYQAYENYTEALNKALTSYAGSEDADRTSLIIAMAEDMRKKDSGSYSRYLTWNGETTATVRSAGYKALAALLYDYACSNPDFSNVDFSSTTAGTALVKAVMKSMSSTSTSYSFEGVDVNLHVFQFGSEKFGNMTCTLNGKQYSAVICSTQTECYETIESYWESLKDLETSALFNIYTALATDIWGKSPSTFTKEFLKGKFEKYQSEILKAGVGDIANALNTCYNYYTYVNKICYGDLDNLENLLGAMGSLKFDDSSITDKAVVQAMKVLKNATSKLNQACADYIAGTLEIPLLFSLKQLTVACPVNVMIYNAAGEQIGYAGEDDLWYEDSIYITKEGDSKVINILSAQDVSVRFIGTAAGTMSCSIEEYTVEGVPIGRLNFYQIPVQEGQELEMKVPERLTGSLQDTCIRTEAENIFPNEYMTVNDTGCVSVTCSVDPQAAKNGCMVSGAGSFVRGDAVVLTALSGENYNFIGWYHDGVLQSTSQVYEFPAIQDVSLSAVFAQPYQGYKVEVTAEKGGTAIGSSVFAANEVATVLASPNKGYAFDGWYVNGGKISDSAEYSFAVQADMLITASFSKISPEPEESPTPQPTETPAPYPSAEPTPQPSETSTSVPNTTPVPQPTTTTVSEYGTTSDIVKSDDAEKTQAQEIDLPNEDYSEPSQTPQANEDELSIQKSDSVVQETEEQNKEDGSNVLLYAVSALATSCVIFGTVWYLWRRKKQ